MIGHMDPYDLISAVSSIVNLHSERVLSPYHK